MGHSLNRTSFTINQNLVIDDKTFNPGYILVSDSKGNVSWKNPSTYIDTTEPLDHFIGELYGGGIVVAVWREQKETVYEKCLIASVRDYVDSSFGRPEGLWRWSYSYPNSAIGLTARSNSFGASNSWAIAAQGPGSSVAKKCLDYVNEDLYGLGVYGDWYLPSLFELNCLANNSGLVDRVLKKYSEDKSISIAIDPGLNIYGSMSLVSNTNSGFFPDYWTSTEFNSGSAWMLSMGSGAMLFATASKDTNRRARPFRLDTKRWNGVTWVQDRRKTGQVLITYNILYNESPTINSGVMVANITAVEVALGNTITTIVGYSNLPADLSTYDHIWDIDPSTNQLTVQNMTKYSQYLQQGGAMFILGENLNFANRNNDLASFITNIGGGTVTYDSSFPVVYDYCSIDSEFIIANNTSSVTFAATGRFSSIGTGTAIVRLSSPVSVAYPVGTTGMAAVWKTGSLSRAPKGAIVVVLDINFISSYYSSGNSADFVANISQILNKS